MSVRIDGDIRKLAIKINSLRNVDFKAINQVISEGLRSSTRERFKEQRTPDGKSWETSIRASTTGGSTLTDSARLKNSIRSRSDKSGAAVGTNLIYAKTHQFGTRRVIRAKSTKGLRFKVNGQWMTKQKVKINIPARPFLGIGDEDTKEIRAVLQNVLMEE